MNRAIRFSAAALLIAALAGMTGCAGYQVGDVKPAPYAAIEKLHIPTFENDTLEPRAATIVTNAVIKQIQQDGTYRVTKKEVADAILTGKIIRLERRQLRAAQTDTLKTTEMQLFIVIEWALIDPATGKKMAYAEASDPSGTRTESVATLQHRPGRVVGRTIQFLDPNFQLSERNALPLAAEDAAEQLVSQLSDGW